MPVACRDTIFMPPKDIIYYYTPLRFRRRLPCRHAAAAAADILRPPPKRYMICAFEARDAASPPPLRCRHAKEHKSERYAAAAATHAAAKTLPLFLLKMAAFRAIKIYVIAQLPLFFTPPPEASFLHYLFTFIITAALLLRHAAIYTPRYTPCARAEDIYTPFSERWCCFKRCFFFFCAWWLWGAQDICRFSAPAFIIIIGLRRHAELFAARGAALPPRALLTLLPWGESAASCCAMMPFSFFASAFHAILLWARHAGAMMHVILFFFFSHPRFTYDIFLARAYESSERWYIWYSAAMIWYDIWYLSRYFIHIIFRERYYYIFRRHACHTPPRRRFIWAFSSSVMPSKIIIIIYAF